MKRVTKGTKKPKKNRDWSKAEKVLTKEKTEVVWIPLKYEEDIYQSYTFYDQDTSYINDIRYLFQQPIYEGLVVGRKNKKELFSYVVKLAFDPIKMKGKENQIFSLDIFSGHLTKTNWEEEIEFSLKYEDGKHKSTLTPISPKAKVRSCTTYYITTDWWSQASWAGGSAAPNFMYTGIQIVTVCNHPARDSDLFGPVIVPPTGGYPADATYVYHPPSVFPDPCDMLAYPNGPSTALAKSNLENAMNAFGTGFGIQSFTWDKATTLARAVNGELGSTKIMNIGGRTVAGLGAVTSIGTFVIGVTDGSGFTWDDDGKNLLLAGLGITSVALAFSPAAPVYALGVSTAALIIAFIPDSSSPCQ